MVWKKVSDLIRVAPPSSPEEVLVRSLIKGIRKQIKYLEGQRKKMANHEKDIKKKIEKAAAEEKKDLQENLIRHEEEAAYFSQHMNILQKKLELAEARLNKITSFDKAK